MISLRIKTHNVLNIWFPEVEVKSVPTKARAKLLRVIILWDTDEYAISKITFTGTCWARWADVAEQKLVFIPVSHCASSWDVKSSFSKLSNVNFQGRLFFSLDEQILMLTNKTAAYCSQIEMIPCPYYKNT